MDITKFVCPHCGGIFFADANHVYDVTACPFCEVIINKERDAIGTYEWED